MKVRYAIALAASLVAFPAAAQVKVSDPWVRSTVPAQKATGAFMKMKSAGDAKLVAASSPVAKVVEVHEMSMKDNVMQMRAVDAIALPAGRTVHLKPGGYHVMLMELVKPIEAGAAVPITLTFMDKDGKKFTQEVSAEARAPGDDGSKHKGHKH